jgi:hypothetical protein
MDRSPQNRFESLFVEKNLRFLIKNLSENVSAWRNLF